MAESVGAAVFTVDADISRFDQRLSEAQSRAVRAVQGINSSLQSIQGADVVINQVGTLNLSNVINQIKAYRGELGALKTQLHTLRNTPTTRATMLASGRTAGYDTGATMTLKNYETEMARVVAGVKAKESQVATIISETTAKIKASMAERVAASKQFHNAITRQYERLKGGYFPGIGEPTKDITVPGLDPKNMRTRAVMSSTAVGTASVGATSGKYSTGSYAESVLKEAELLRSGYEDQLAMMEKYNVRRNAVYESGIQRFQTISRQEEVALEQHNAKMKALMKSGYQGIGFEDYIDRYPYSSGKKATAVGSLEMSREEVNFKKIAQNKAREYSNIGTSMFLGDFKSSEEASKALAKVNKESTAMSKAMKEAHEPASLLDRAFGRLTRTLFAFTGVYAFVELISSLHQAVSAGVEFNKTIENTQIGIAALLESEGKFTKGDTLLTGTESMNAALTQSDKIIKQLQYDNLQTIATFEQLSRAYQSALAPGLAAGFDLEQVRQFTLSMVQAAAAMQLPFEQMAEEIRSLLRGSITPRNTIIATNLGITNEDIRKYKGDANALFSFIMGKLSEFSKYGPILQDTFSGLLSNMTDVFRMTAGEAGKGYFDYLKNIMKDITNFMADTSNALEGIQLRPSAVQIFKDFYSVIEATTTVALALGYALAQIVSTVGAMGRSLSVPFDVMSSKIASVVDQLKFMDAYLLSINKNKVDPKMYLEDTNLGIAPSWSNTDVNMKQKQDQKQIDYTQQVIEATSQRAAAELQLKEVEQSRIATGELDSQKQTEAVNKIYESNQIINSYGDQMMTAAEKAHELARQVTAVGYAGNDMRIGLEGALKKIHELSGVDVSSFGRSIDDRIEGLKIKIKTLQDNPLASSGEVTARARYAEQTSRLDRAANAAAAGAAATTPAAMERIAEIDQENRMKSQQELELTLQEKRLEDQRRELKKSKSGGGAPRSFTKQFDTMERDMRQFQQRSEEAWSQYWIEVFETSGMPYEAAKEKTDNWYRDQIFSVTEASRKISDKMKELQEDIATGEASKRGNRPETEAHLAKLQDELNKAKEMEAPLLKIVDVWLLLRQAQDEYHKLDVPAQWTEEQLAISKLVGTLEEQAYWENTLNKIKAEQSKQDKDPAIKALIDQRTALENERRSALAGDDFGAGFMVTARDAFQELGGWGQIGADAFTMLSDSISSTADTLTEFLTTGKIEFADFANSIIKDMIRIIMQRLIMNAVFGVINLISPLSGGAIGGGTALGGGVSGTGGFLSQVVTKHNGLGTVSKMVPDSYFFNAPRLHDGLAADEYPAILQKGEAVIPKNHSLANTSNITVNITQNGDSGNASDAQILAKIVAKAVDEKIQQSFRKQMRNGGILDSHKRVA